MSKSIMLSSINKQEGGVVTDGSNQNSVNVINEHCLYKQFEFKNSFLISVTQDLALCGET